MAALFQSPEEGSRGTPGPVSVFYSPPHIPVGLPGLRKVWVDSGDSGWIPGIPGEFQWNVEELHIKEYESGNSRNSGWILDGFQA
jgi:hypothetical protein